MFSKKSTKRPFVKARNQIVALDIGTEVVKALIASAEDDGTLRIVGVGRCQQGPSDMYSGAIADISAVVANCEKALADAEEQAGFQAKRVVVGIAGELVKGVTNTIRYRRPQPDRPLDEAEMNFIIDKVHERAGVKAQKQIALESGNEDVEVKLVNSALVGINIDGYKVSNPLGFQGKDVAIQIFTAFAPMMHINALETVADELSLELLAVAAEPFAVSRSVLGDDASTNFTAILIDIGGGTTDIAVVNDGGVEGTRMFGIGGASFTRAIANDLEVSLPDAEKLKLHIGRDQLDASVKNLLDQSIDDTLAIWISGVELALQEFESLDHLPRKILVCGGGASLDKLVAVLQDSAWAKDLPFAGKLTVQRIKPVDAIGIIDDTGDVADHTLATALGLLRVGHDTIASNQDSTIKDKINRLLRV